MNFSIEKKGYNIDEVDAYVDDLEAKYMTLQAQNSELEQKLATAKRLIRRFSDTENALKQSIADSKRAAAYMISDARDRSETLLDSARESCGEIISELDVQIAERMKTISLMKEEVAAFKDALFTLYSSHIELIDTLAVTAENFEYQPDYTAVADAVDEFEDQGEPDCQVPEFVDYPEESIFAEIGEEEVPAEGFVLDEAESVASDADDIAFETAGEDEDYSQIGLDNGTSAEDGHKTAGFRIIDTDAPAEDAVAEEGGFEPFDDGAEAEGAEGEGAEGAAASEDTDYFKFLEEFANSEESES